MNLKLLYCTLLVIMFSVIAKPQKQQADAFYANQQYAKAIPKYLKVVKKNRANKQDALIKLATSYKLLNNYTEAATYYKQALALGGDVPAEVHYNYGNVLKAQGNHQQARNQFIEFLEKTPTDDRAKVAIKSCKEIDYWQTKPKEYDVENVGGINTKNSEFCPAIYKDKLVYTSDRQEDLVDFTTHDFDGHSYLNVYQVPLSKLDKNKEQVFSKYINTNYHDGPLAFGDKTVYITRVNYTADKNNKAFVNRAKLYSATEDENWKNLTPLPFNSDNYSVAHPAINADGTCLFFTSDKDGGYGGTDIWMCKKQGSEWGTPVNLGPDINTSGNESFPYVRKDGALFFSSNGLPGFGGLDIFSAKELEGKWLLNRNEAMNLNSPADDFGIVFQDDSTGYFSSNRDGTKGGDDIYKFKYRKKLTTISGTLLLTENLNSQAKKAKVYLLDESGKRIDSTYTNERGFFAFNNLDVDKHYLVQVDETDPQYVGKARFYMADGTNTIMRVTHTTTNGQRFIFRNLPIDPYSLPELYTEDNLTLAGNIVYGEKPSKPLSNSILTIRNIAGDVLEKIKTNALGAFVFRNLPVDQNYLLEIDETDITLPPNTRVALTNKNGKELKVIRTDAKGRFKFELLSVDKTTLQEMDVNDEDLIMLLTGYILDPNKKPLPNAKLFLVQSGEPVQTIVTDAQGKFDFKNLRADKNYFFTVDETDPKLNSLIKIYIADQKGRIYKELRRDVKGKFQFNLLEVDKYMLAEFEVDDPWLEVMNIKNKTGAEEITIVENIYYSFGDWHLSAEGTQILDKVTNVLVTNPSVNIEISSHTDSRSSDQFNLQLSQKRAKAAVDYIISKGVQAKRLKAVGYGETRLLNNCKNGVECTDEEHGKNRRTEFKIVETPKQ